MNQFRSKATIGLKDELGFVYAVCSLSYEEWQDGRFRYVFRPNYSVIDLLSKSFFQGIPGLNLDLRKEEYVRENRVPCFISERVPQENREDYWELLHDAGLEFMDPIRYLIQTKLQYFGDDFFMVPYEEKKTVCYDDGLGRRTNHQVMRLVLGSLARGDDVILDGATISDSSRATVYRTLLFFYRRSLLRQKEAIERGLSAPAKRGRKPADFDRMALLSLYEETKRGAMTATEAAKRLGVSVDTYYRALRKMREKGYLP